MILFSRLWWNSGRLALEESRCSKICHSFTLPIPSDYLSLNSIKNAACSSFWLFYYNFIPEAENILDVFSFLNYYTKSSVICLFQRLDMRKQSNERHIFFLIIWPLLICDNTFLFMFLFLSIRFFVAPWSQKGVWSLLFGFGFFWLGFSFSCEKLDYQKETPAFVLNTHASSALQHCSTTCQVFSSQNTQLAPRSRLC